MKTLKLTQAEALQLLDYNFVTGELRWKVRTPNMFTSERSCKAWNSRFAGKVAGTITHNPKFGTSYVQIRIGDTLYLAHRIINLMVTGSRKEVGHIDGNGLNNAWNNLREVTPTDANRNRKRFNNNTSGVTGVLKIGDRYRASICHKGKTEYLGTYDTIEKATMVRKQAERELGFHPNHGRA